MVVPSAGAEDHGDIGRFGLAIAAIDAANAADPVSITVELDGVPVERPKELVHAEAMTDWVRRLDPEADEVQLLAARAHHLRRWTSPRDAFPEGRAGYLKWRIDARRRHAEDLSSILRDVGYDDPTIDAVAAIVTKEGLGRGDLPDVDGRPPAVQTHEDALCLVFLELQFGDTADRLGDEKMIDVLVRTLAKMGARGRTAALGLPLSDRETALVTAALARAAATD